MNTTLGGQSLSMSVVVVVVVGWLYDRARGEDPVFAIFGFEALYLSNDGRFLTFY